MAAKFRWTPKLSREAVLSRITNLLILTLPMSRLGVVEQAATIASDDISSKISGLEVR